MASAALGAGRCHGLLDRRLQRIGQQSRPREQALQRIADQRELLGQPGQAMRLAAGHGRPGVLGAGHALARLRDPRRIETAQARRLVVERGRVIELVGLAHGLKPRRIARVRGRRAWAQKNSTSCASRSDTSGCPPTLMRSSASSREADPLGVHVGFEQAAGLGVVEGRAQMPQAGHAAFGRGAQAGAQLAQARHGGTVVAAHDGQHIAFHRRARRHIGCARRRTRTGAMCRATASRRATGRPGARGRHRPVPARAVLREHAASARPLPASLRFR